MYSSLAVYSALQVSCLEGIGNMHQAMSLYKLKAFVTCTITELSTSEPLPIYPLLWTTHLQSTVAVIN